MSGSLIRDALLNTKGGKTLVVEARQFAHAEYEKRNRERLEARRQVELQAEAERIRQFNESRRIAGRIRQLKETAFEIFVRGMHRKDLYEMYKGKIRKIGEIGGSRFDEALNVLKTSKREEVADYFQFVA